MKKNFVSNYFFNLTYEIVAILSLLISTPYISRVLGVDAVGDYGFTAGIVSYFGIVAVSGTVNYAKREIAFQQDNKHERSKIFLEILYFRFICILVVSIAYLFFLLICPAKYKLLYIVQFLTVLSWAADISWFFQGIENFRVTALRSTFVKLGSTLLIFLCVKTSTDLWKYVLIICGSTLIGNVCLWPYLKGNVIKIKISELCITKHFKGIMLLFVSVVAIQIYTVLDQTMLGFLANTTEVGYYVQAQKIIKFALTVVASFVSIFLPRIAVLYKNNDRNQMYRYVDIAISYLLLLGLPLMTGCILCSDTFVPLFFGSGYEPVKGLMKILSVLFLILGAGQIAGSFLTAIDKQLECTIAVSVGAVLNFVLNSFLIIRFNSLGAAIASVIAETVVTIIEIVMINKYLILKYSIKSFFKYVFATCIMIFSILIIQFWVIVPIVQLVCSLLIGCIIYFLSLIILKEKLVCEIVNKVRKRKVITANYDIFISTFGFKCISTPNGIPIEVGAAKRSDFIYDLRDDVGDHISEENPYYGELTGLYWIWKNVDLSQKKFVGYSHYNKRLNIRPKEILRFLSNNNDGWIVASNTTIPAHSDVDEWNTFLSIIREDFSDYYETVIELYGFDGSSSICNPANMFITSADDFSDYCLFLFDVCKKLREKIGDNTKEKYNQRYCAFFAERLLTAYLHQNKKCIHEVSIKKKCTLGGLFAFLFHHVRGGKRI